MQDWLCLGSAEPSGFNSVRVWHDGQGYASAWLLEWLLLQHMRSGEWWQYAVSSSGSSSSTAWIKGGGIGPGGARVLRLAASGIRETCPLPALTAAGLRQEFEQLQQLVRQPGFGQPEQQLQAAQQQQQSGVAEAVRPAVLAAATVAAATDSAVDAAAGICQANNGSSSGTTIRRSNPFAVAFTTAAACDPAVLDVVGSAPAVLEAYSGSNNPFDDSVPVTVQQQKAAAAAADVADLWPQQQQQQDYRLPDSEGTSLDSQQQQQPEEEQHDWQQQRVVQLPAIKVLQAQGCDVSYDEDLQTFTPLSTVLDQQQQQQHDCDVFTYMPAAAVLEQQDRQLWPRRTSSWQRHQQELSQQQQIQHAEQLQPQVDGQQDSQLQCLQAGCGQLEHIARAAGASAACTVSAALADADEEEDSVVEDPLVEDTSDEEAAETAALAAAAPLDAIELKHRGSPRCCQAQTQPQQQLRQVVALRRVHSCEADPTAGAALSPGGSQSHKHAVSSSNAGSSSSRRQLPLRRVCSSDAEGNAAAGSPSKTCSSSSSRASPGQSNSPKSRRQAGTAAAAAADAQPSTPDPPSYSQHLLYDSASSAVPQPLQQMHIDSLGLAPAVACTDHRTAAAAAAAAAARAGSAGKASRRVSGTAGVVRLVPLVDYDDSSSAPSSSGGSSSSRNSSDSDADQAGQTAGSSSNGSRQVNRQDSDRSQQGRVRQRLPTPKASLTGDEADHQQVPTAAAADESAGDEADKVAAAAAAAANSLVAGIWQQRQQQIVRPGSAAKAVRFYEWVEQLEFGGRGCGSDDDDSSSVESFTEEQLLEAQVRQLLDYT
jgi:hypothetical protein